MDDSVNYAEYTVEKKAVGKHKTKKILFILMYVAFLALLIGLAVAFSFWPIGAIAPLLLYIFWGLTWKYTQLEHKYEVRNAKFIVSNIYGRKRQVTQFEALISELSLIAPMTDEYAEEYKKGDKILEFRGDESSPDSYFAVQEKDGTRTVVYFESTNKMIKTLKFYNKKTVVTELRY